MNGQLSLAELQMLAESEFSIADTRQDLNRLVEFFSRQEWHEQAISTIGNVRKLSIDILKKQKCFFVPEDMVLADLPEEFQADALGLVRKRFITMSGRFVYSVMDVHGDVMGFCGWDKFEQPKYLDSKNHGYKAKAYTLFGMEELPVYYSNNKPVYLVEGIVCCLYLRMCGLQALAVLGSMLTTYVITILRRFGNRLCVIPDNDTFQKELSELGEKTSGEHFVQQAKRMLPKAVVIQSRVAKDVDDSRLIDDGKYAKAFVDELRAVMQNPFIIPSTIYLR